MAGAVLVGYDGSDASRLAVDVAAERCAALKKRLVLVNVVPANLRQLSFTEFVLPNMDLSKLINVDKFQDAARKKLEQVAADLAKRGVDARAVVRAGDTADELLQAARDEGADEIVLGYMSYERALPYGVGSVAEKVLRYADRSVTIVRPPAAARKG
jgi:nucleotide-binding universal stress UspA family protein